MAPVAVSPHRGHTEKPTLVVVAHSAKTLQTPPKKPDHLITLLRQRQRAARVKRIVVLRFSLVAPVVVFLMLFLVKT